MEEEMEVPDYVLPPNEAFRYWPPPELMLIGEGENRARLIFYNTSFSDYEKNMLTQFQEKLAQSEIQLPEYMVAEELLRMLHARRFDISKAMVCVKDYIAWKDSTVPRGCQSLYQGVLPFLNSGAFYVHGRDHRYRPLIVINLGRIINFVPDSNDAIKLLCFLLSYVVEYMFIPGQIENWVLMTDLCNIETSKLPIGKFKQFIGICQSVFRCRVAVNYIVNCQPGINMLWNCVKKLLDANTKKKIQFEKSNSPEDLPNHFNLSQVEEKYGGTAPNATEFWPPIMPGPPFNSRNEEEGAFLRADTFNPNQCPSKMANKQEEVKKVELVEEDDEFEEFEVHDWAENAEDQYDIKQWEEDWDDDDEEDCFAAKLRQELDSH